MQEDEEAEDKSDNESSLTIPPVFDRETAFSALKYLIDKQKYNESTFSDILSFAS